MKAESLLDAIREEFVQRLQRKTSWGRNELISEFDQAMLKVVAGLIELDSKYTDSTTTYPGNIPWTDDSED